MERIEAIGLKKENVWHLEKLLDFQIRAWALHSKIHYISDPKDKDNFLRIAQTFKGELEKFKKAGIPVELRLSLDLMLSQVKGLISYAENTDVHDLLCASAPKPVEQTSGAELQGKKGIEV